MKNKEFGTKQLVISFAILFVVLSTIAIILFSQVDLDKNKDTSVGLKNPDNIFEESDSPSVSPEIIHTNATFSVLKDNTMAFLSIGDYSGLTHRLNEDEATYTSLDSEIDGETPADYIARIRHDVATITNIGVSSGNGKTLLHQCYSAEVVASAIVYTSMQEKYLAFINYDSCVVPAVKSEDVGYVNLKKADIPQATLKTMLKDICNSQGANYLGIDAYSMNLWDKQYTLYLVLDETSCWIPYLLTPVEEQEDCFTVSDAIGLIPSISKNNLTLDEVIFY